MWSVLHKPHVVGSKFAVVFGFYYDGENVQFQLILTSLIPIRFCALMTVECC